MQNDVCDNELRQSIAAFAILSVYHLIHILYIWFSRCSSLLHPRLDWEILILLPSWCLFGVAGSILTLYTVRTRDTRFLLGLKSVAFLSAEVLLVITVGRCFFRIYQYNFRLLHVGFGVVSHLLVGFGVWLLIDRGVELIWVAPSSFHFVLSIFLVSLYINRATYYYRWSWDWMELGWWGVGFLVMNLVAFVLPVLGFFLNWGWLHLSQCLACVVIALLCDVRKWWKAGHPVGDESHSRPLNTLPKGTFGASTRALTGGTCTQDRSDAESAIGSGSWEDKPEVRPPPRIHVQA
ncbi:hypothetical protein F5144DRAFT_85473 [Chaetomium tenue]|uniref:Uncharacterized protein n=1 Tax=Chaetomium tenue TaxID=1854479 RepID=A0ACB7PSE3_9PEZI|nr:hypothetical protein F5144DRAFT_85473 [Chaetomium globosum]